MKKILFFIILIVLTSMVFAANISGFVHNEKNGEPIEFCNIFIKNMEIGDVSNKKGFYSIKSVPIGNHEIIFQKIGYKTVSKKIKVINLDESIFINTEISSESIKMKTIKLVEKKHKMKYFSINAPKIEISKLRTTSEDIKDIPQILEPDIFRAVQKLPGVTSISDFSSGLYVRGGSQDQNLILLDGIDVYNPTHFGGIFSTFNADAVSGVDLLKGGFPAKYGGRLSSVLDVSNRDGNRKYHQGTMRVSLISSSATLEGPWKIGDQKGSYMGSFRRTYLELMQKFLDIPDYYFYDGHAKVNYDINPMNKLMNSVYFGKDKLTLDVGADLVIEWGNNTFSSQWIHVFNSRLFSQFIVAGSNYFSNFKYENSDETFKRKNDVYDLTIKSNFEFNFENIHLVNFGIEEKFNNILFKSSMEGSDIDDSHMPNVDVVSNSISAYLQDDWTINNIWSIQGGLRINYFNSHSKTLKNSPDANYFKISPRFSLRYNTSLHSNIYFNTGRYYQYLTSVNLGISSPMDLWFPLDGSVKPGISNHYILGFKGQLTNNYAFDVSGYFKDYENLLGYRPEVDFEWNNETGKLADIYNIGDGFSYGLDFILRNDWQNIEGFISYSWGITKKKLENVNINPETGDEEYFFPKYDKTHQVNIVETLNITDKFDWKLFGFEMKSGLSYAFSTGQPYEIPEYYYQDGNNIEIVYSYKDRKRTTNYSRCDISLKFKKYYSKFNIEPYIQIINLFNHANVYTVTHIPEIDYENETLTYETEETTMFPKIPFIGINIEW